jgi:hypothetical protein
MNIQMSSDSHEGLVHKYQNLRMLKSLILKRYSICIYYTQPPTHFNSPLNYLEYLIQHKYCANSYQTILSREWCQEKCLYVFSTGTKLFWIFLIHSWLNLKIWNPQILTPSVWYMHVCMCVWGGVFKFIM